MGMSADAIGLQEAGVVAMSMLPFMPYAIGSDKIGKEKGLLIGQFFQGVSYFALAHCYDEMTVGLSMLMFGQATTLLFPTPLGIVSDNTKLEDRSNAMAMLRTLADVGG